MTKRTFFALFMISLFSFLSFTQLSWQEKPSKNYKIYFAQNEALKFYHPKDLRKISQTLHESELQRASEFSKIPFIEKAVFSSSIAGKNQVKIFLQKPLMAFLNQGVYKLVNISGEIFSEISQYKIPDLPVMTGEKFLIKKNRLNAVTLFNKLPDNGVLSKKNLSEVLQEAEQTFIFSGVKGQVFIGKGDIEKKVNRLNKIIKYLRFHGIESKSLDARFKDKVIVSVRENKKI